LAQVVRIMLLASLTLALTPGTISPLQPWQKNLRRFQPNLMLYLSMSFLARAAWRLASSRSSYAVKTESWSNVLAATVACIFASFFFIAGILSFPRAK